MSRQKKTLNELAEKASKQYFSNLYGKNWWKLSSGYTSEARMSIAAESSGYFHGYLAGRRAERRAAAKRRAEGEPCYEYRHRDGILAELVEVSS